ncbi:MAG: DUF4105 domain-containing protein [Lutibacter sp.]|nr:DUF4105 domain-containing protein [Lutibacter sp.]MBP9601709.1 DUF4105 domain-containing protein [Lutibacter sp.]
MISNKIKLTALTTFIALLFTATVFSQELTTKAAVSVITCGPGDQLYSTFGHSAFRVYDFSIGLDKVYNYGTFDFNAPNFYLNFVKGKLTYQLSTSNFSWFLQEYQYSNRWVKTQDLNLTPDEVKEVFAFLENNATPEHRDYQYDFFFDNCSTKIEAVLKTVLKGKIEFSNNHITSEKTHRDLIADYTKTQPWGKFGIDLALGSVIDRKATKDEYKFLPDYIFQALENATINTNGVKQPLVKKEQQILREEPTNKPLISLGPTPFNIMLSLSILIIFITYKNFKHKKRSKFIDFSLFFLTGIIGVAVLLMWFATSHTATYKNLNFLWAFAPNFLISFYLFKTTFPNWIYYYLKIILALLALMLGCWIFKIQVFNLAFLPFIIALGIRYLFLLRYKPSK